MYYWTGTASLDLWVANLAQWQRGGELRLQPAAIGMQGRLGGSLFRGDKLYLQHSLQYLAFFRMFLIIRSQHFEHQRSGSQMKTAIVSARRP